jgi:hypothetical protein
MKTWAAIATAVLAVLATGCGSAGKTCLPDEGVGAVEEPTAAVTAYLTGVSVTRSGCNDRVTFTFARRAPGFRVEYRRRAEAQTEDASGRRIPVAGTKFLVVRLENTRTARTNADGAITRTYAGPRRIAPGDAHHALEAVKTGDFEAVVTWAIGLDGKRPYTVSTAPHSIVVVFG